MSLKPMLLHYVLNLILMRLNLAPITPLSGVKFIRVNEYSPSTEKQNEKQFSMETDVVIRSKLIEVHTYSPDPRERHITTSHASTKHFLRVFIKRRIEMAVAYRAGQSSAAKDLSPKSDTETFKNAVIEFSKERSRLMSEYDTALEKNLEGPTVYIASLLIGL